jgi:hypothetical protein
MDGLTLGTVILAGFGGVWAAMCAVSLIALVVAGTSQDRSKELSRFIVGFGSALVLWSTAVFGLH